MSYNELRLFVTSLSHDMEDDKWEFTARDIDLRATSIGADNEGEEDRIDSFYVGKGFEG